MTACCVHFLGYILSWKIFRQGIWTSHTLSKNPTPFVQISLLFFKWKQNFGILFSVNQGHRGHLGKNSLVRSILCLIYFELNLLLSELKLIYL